MNLQLIPCEPLHLATVLEDKKDLEPLLGVSVPDTYCQMGILASVRSAVVARTLSEGHGSVRVLERLGMRRVGESDEALCWMVDRKVFNVEGDLA